MSIRCSRAVKAAVGAAAPGGFDSRFPPLDVRRAELNPAALISMAELLHEPEQTQRRVVEGVIPSGGLTLVSAAPKVGKSTLMRVLSVAVARGEPWLGRHTVQGPVLYWCLEDKRAEVRRHYVAMGACASDPIHLVFGRVAQREPMALLSRWVRTVRARLVVVDPLFRLLQVHDVSDYAQVTRGFDPLIALARDSGAAVALTHHQRKSGGADGTEMLGSQAIFGSVDNAMFMYRRGETRTIRTQVRIGEDMPPAVIAMTRSGGLRLGGARRARQAESIDAAIVRCVADSPEPMTIAEVRSAVARRARDVHEALARLSADGVVERTGRGRRGDPHRFRFPASGNRERDVDEAQQRMVVG